MIISVPGKQDERSRLSNWKDLTNIWNMTKAKQRACFIRYTAEGPFLNSRHCIVDSSKHSCLERVRLYLISTKSSNFRNVNGNFTHWGPENWLLLYRYHLQMHLTDCSQEICHLERTEVCFQGSSWGQVYIGSGSGMDWCRHAPSHSLIQYSTRTITRCGFTRMQYVKG